MQQQETRHTPGPWVLSTRFQDKVDVLHGAVTPGAASRVVARVTVRDSWRAEQEANARLIATAPELLAKLAETRKHLPLAAASWNEGLDENPGYSIHVDAVLKLIADIDTLISKATASAA